MSITVNLFYTGKEDSAREFVKEMKKSGIVDAIRAKEGNLAYDYYFSADDPQTVLLVDTWKDQAAIDEHHESDLMPKIAALRDKYGLIIRAKRYIDDPEGFSDHDRSFLKTKQS